MVMLFVIATVLGLAVALIAYRKSGLLDRLHMAALFTILAVIALVILYVILARMG